VNLDYHVWQAQLAISLLFAVLLARVARRKGRHPFGAALLLLVFANGWPLVFGAVGQTIANAWNLNDTARLIMSRVYSYGGVMFGIVTSFAIIGCLRPIPKPLSNSATTCR
jgi:energy-coupling factor transporter transmembrane protein EcfT